LFEQHAAFVAKFIVRMGVPRVDVDDLLQEVFLVAHRLGGYQPGPAKPTTFLASVAVKLVRTERRKRRVRSFVEADDERVQLARAPGDPEQDVADRQQLGELKRIVEQLDDDKRAVFVLADLHGETVVSIASGLGIPVSAQRGSHFGKRRTLVRSRNLEQEGGRSAKPESSEWPASAIPEAPVKNPSVLR
jgi:RNA polymerase sigma-70 factor (ECF subfamily)